MLLFDPNGATQLLYSSFHEKGRDHEPPCLHAVQRQVTRGRLFATVKRTHHTHPCLCTVDSSADPRVCVTSYHWQYSQWPLSIFLSFRLRPRATLFETSCAMSRFHLSFSVMSPRQFPIHLFDRTQERRKVRSRKMTW